MAQVARIRKESAVREKGYFRLPTLLVLPNATTRPNGRSKRSIAATRTVPAAQRWATPPCISKEEEVIYISGPITGIEGFNEPAFRAMAAQLNDLGFATLVPHDIPVPDHEGECPPGYATGETGHSSACHMRANILALLSRCDMLQSLPGWLKSRGARVEVEVAAICGMPIFMPEVLPVRWEGEGNANPEA